MDGDLTTIICAVITAISTIIVAVVTSHTRSETKRGADASEATNRAINDMRHDINQIKNDLVENNLETCRVDLRQALEHSRDDIRAILELARRYFVDMHGDADLGPKFLFWVEEKRVRRWAKENRYSIGEIIGCAKHPGGNK